MINITDLENTKFKQAKKRVLINSISLELYLKAQLAKASKQAPQTSLLVTDATQFKTKTSIKGDLSPIQAQISMDDLFVVQQLANKVTDEAL